MVTSCTPRYSRTPKANSMLNDDSELFQGSVAAMSAAEGYLGSVRVVEGLLRVMVSDWTDALGSGTATADMAKKLATEYSEILIGNRDGFGKVPGWTKLGGIDVFVASELGLPERGRDAIENALVQMLTQTTEIVNYADEPGVLAEHWQWQVDAMFEEYVNLFLGVPGEPADEPSEPLLEGWITINAGDDDEGGQRVYIDGSGTMQTGHFKGKTFDQAFGKGKVKAKRDEDQSEPPPAATPKPTAPDAPAGDGKPKQAGAIPAPPSGLDSFEADKVAQWHRAATEGNLAKFSSASALDGIESDTAKAYHSQLLKASGVKKSASKSVVVDPAVVTGQPSAAHYASTKKMSDDYDAFIMQAEKEKRLAFDDYDFAKLSEKHQSEFNAVSAFVAGGFTEMNANADSPASKKFKQFLDKLPDDTRHKSIYRVLGFDTPEAQSAYMASIAAPHGQPKAFSSWTAFDPTAKGATPMNNIGLDVASQFGDNLVILKYENPTGAKNLSFAYGDVTDGKTELVLQKGHRFETKSVSKDANGRTVVTVGPPSKAKTDYKSKAKVQPLEESDAYPGNKKTVDVYKSLVKGDVDMATLVGAPDSSTIKYSRGPYEWDDEGDGKAPPSVVMQGSGPGIKMMTREVTRDPSSGKLVMINHELTTTQPGLGRSILKNQVLAARKAGINEIRTTAAGGPGEEMNGYYTWPRYGYDASIESLRKVMPSREKIEKMQFQNTEIGKKAKAKLIAKHDTLDALESKYKAKSILDVMATQEGRDFWKANGFGFEGSFDLSEGSRSNKVLDAYLAAKGEL